MLEEAYSEYEEMEKDMNEMNNKFDNLFLEIEEKVFIYIHMSL